MPFDNTFVYAEGLDIIRLSSLTDASVTQSHKNEFSNSNMATTTINVFFLIPYFLKAGLANGYCTMVIFSKFLPF